MKTRFITLKNHKALNMDYIISIEFIGSIDASMLGEFIIQNHQDGNAYIKFIMSNNELEFWAFKEERTAMDEYYKLMQKIAD